MVDRIERRGLPMPLRAALIGVGLAATWFTISTALDAPSAQAAETTGGSATSSLVSLADDALSQIDPIVGSTFDSSVDSSLDAVTSLAGSSPVAAVTAPIAQAADAAVQAVVAPLPVVGQPIIDTTGPAPVGTVLTPIASTIDSVLGVTGGAVGDAGGVADGLLTPVLHLNTSATQDVAGPPIGFPSHATMLSLRSAASAPLETNATAVSANEASGAALNASPAGPASPRGPMDVPGAESTTTSSSSSNTYPAGSAATLGDGFALAPVAHRTNFADGAAAPISATYDTDTSPD